jgi:hypothetical protein
MSKRAKVKGREDVAEAVQRLPNKCKAPVLTLERPRKKQLSFQNLMFY